jgi:hypothetical protein
MPQRDTFLIIGLHRKRARIAGEIEALEQRAVPLREALAQVDAVIRLFQPQSNPELIPAIRPAPRGLFFRHGEQVRLCLAALREARGPKKTRWVAEYVMAAKGLPTGEVGSVVTHQVRNTLGRLASRGVVRRVVTVPETWWELVG